ncbi:MAG: hypothetical protein MTP17_01080 [Candidatus Midichloria sp.]|nr:MAG: hypothetical protein MTP17_01080 [Candidatus Midichloria sp.]
MNSRDLTKKGGEVLNNGLEEQLLQQGKLKKINNYHHWLYPVFWRKKRH